MNTKIVIAVCLLAGPFTSSCTKKNSTNSTGAPISTFNITFKGKTFSVVSTTNGNSVSAITETAFAGPTSTFFTELVTAKNGDIDASIFGEKSDLSTALGTYKLGSWSSGAYSYGIVEVTDFTDGGKVYSCYGDTTSSTVTISISNGTEIKGTFNILLTYNGATYPATGDFDYKK